ncbi:MAG: hypothetical protein DHS20C05_00480 [Hyphococcus sp.]|nr:MAG: hypothetical protein DHS20C05_00480 [Marinicaulis sp.]
MAPNGTGLSKQGEEPPAPVDLDATRSELTSVLLTELVKPEDVHHIAGPWTELAEKALERNPFFEPWALIPALEQYADKHVRLACVWKGDDRSELMGIAPVRAMRGYARLPVGFWGTWRHPHCFYAAPLLHGDNAAAVAASMLDLLCDGEEARSFLRLFQLGVEGPVMAAFRHAARLKRRDYYCAGSYERAILHAGQSPSKYIEQNIRKKKQKEFNRLRKRLSEQGPITFHQLTDKNSIQEWGKLFLDMEHRGWRGDEKSSLASSRADSNWFESVLTGAYTAGQLSFMRLDCGNQPIAMLVSFGAADKFSIKICHDPAFSRYSPGVMIELEATKHLLNDHAFTFMDSCAAPDHAMINSLWPQRRRITGLNVSGVHGKRILRLCKALEKARLQVRGGVNILRKDAQ